MRRAAIQIEQIGQNKYVSESVKIGMVHPDVVLLQRNSSHSFRNGLWVAVRVATWKSIIKGKSEINFGE